MEKEGRRPTPIINPSATAAAFRTWRTHWRNPKQPPTDKRRLALAEIKIHSALFDFKNGQHSDLISIERVHAGSRKRSLGMRLHASWQTLGQGELLRLIACYSPKPARSVAAKSISMRALFGSWKNNCQTPAACPPPGNRRRSYVRP